MTMAEAENLLSALRVHNIVTLTQCVLNLIMIGMLVWFVWRLKKRNEP